MATKSKGKLVVVSGPSGAGKSTVIGHLLKRRDDISFSVSATTRAPRPGETEGVSYFFLSRAEFDALVAQGELLEHAEYAGNCYGTPKAPVAEKLRQGRTVILDIEVQGAAQVKEAMPEAVLVFLTPPGIEELERRLRGRGTDTEEKIRLRLETARREYKLAPRYDYIVINDIAEEAAAELDAIITAEKCRSADRIEFITVEE
jgi:guanylate kinase